MATMAEGTVTTTATVAMTSDSDNNVDNDDDDDSLTPRAKQPRAAGTAA